MIDLSTTYLGMNLRNPVVVSSSPLQKEIGNIRQMEDAGAAAVVMHSLFEEQIELESQELDRSLEHGTESFAESLNYLPDMHSYNLGPEGYLEHLAKVKKAVSIPVVGSLNGVSSGGWVDYADKIEQAGADALELNIYYLPTDIDLSGAELEETYVRLVTDIRARVRLPCRKASL